MCGLGLQKSVREGKSFCPLYETVVVVKCGHSDQVFGWYDVVVINDNARATVDGRWLDLPG